MTQTIAISTEFEFLEKFNHVKFNIKLIITTGEFNLITINELNSMAPIFNVKFHWLESLWRNLSHVQK